MDEGNTITKTWDGVKIVENMHEQKKTEGQKDKNFQLNQIDRGVNKIQYEKPLFI